MSTFFPYTPPNIPLYGVDGRFIDMISSDDIMRLGQTVRVIKSRRGHIRRVYLRALSCHAVRVMAGGNKQSFQQSVRSGRVWALKGVRGSGR